MGVKRGYVIVYRQGETNHCPGCGKDHWWIGRFSAECAFCHTALPLELPETYGDNKWRVIKRDFSVWA